MIFFHIILNLLANLLVPPLAPTQSSQCPLLLRTRRHKSNLSSGLRQELSSNPQMVGEGVLV